MSGDTVRPPHIAHKLFFMETSEFGHCVERCQNQYYISTGHKFCQIFMKLARYGLQTKLNTCVKQLFQIQNRLAVTANQRDGEAAKKEVSLFLSNPLTYHSQTWYIDSWHRFGDTQIIWWPLTSGGREAGSDLISLQGLHVSKPNLAHSLMTLSWWCPKNWASATPRVVSSKSIPTLRKRLQCIFIVITICP